MKTEVQPFYSCSLEREMPVRVYGHGGKPILYIPCQNGIARDFEGFGLSAVLEPWIEGGRCRVWAVNTADAESWSKLGGDPGERIRRHEDWIQYLARELAPFILSRSQDASGIMSFGCSLGASHALNLYLRFPEMFDRCLALSGMYHASYFFGDYSDSLVYQNSPVDYLANMPADHPFIEKYKGHRAVACTGQGPWEEPWSTRALEQRLRALDIPAWVDYWGWDVSHDWPWWRRQLAYFLPYLLDERN
jgi:esterase/lipase superfamily enzyme